MTCEKKLLNSWSVCKLCAFLLSAVEPFTKLAPFAEAKSMGLANDEAGEKRVQSYREALTKEALNKYYPPIQEVKRS